MTRLATLFIYVSFSVLISFSAHCKAQKRPNILFIMSDDHSTGAISAYGSILNKTPNIDRLATQGMLFNRATVTNSICGPSRAVILTGKYSHENGFLRNPDYFNGKQQTIPKLMQKAGYETAIVGKWHLKTQPTGFDYYNIIPGQGDYWDCRFKEIGTEWHDYNDGGTVVPGYLTDVITDLSIQYLENRKNEKPFYLMVHHKAPHNPFYYPEKYAELFKEDLIKCSTYDDDYDTRQALKNYMHRWSEFEDIRLNIIKGDSKKEYTIPERSDTAAFKDTIYNIMFKGYLRLIASLDDNIGRLMNYIDSSGIGENTIVIYTSDNGWFTGDHGLFNKMWMYEPSLKVPLIIRYPETIEPGSVSDAMVRNIDFGPSFLSIAGAKIPGDIQGQSFSDIILGKEWSNPLVSSYYRYYNAADIPNQYGVYTNNWKLICFPDLQKEPYWELFDLQSDPLELNNIYDSPDHEGIITGLKAELYRLQVEEYGDSSGHVFIVPEKWEFCDCMDSAYREYEALANKHNQERCKTRINNK